MKKEQATAQTILSYLAKNPNSDAKTIEKNTKIPVAEVRTVVNELTAEKKVSVVQKGAKSAKLFSVVSMPSVEKAKADKAAEKPVVKAKAEKKEVEVKPAAKSEGKNFGRHFGKYSFNGQEDRKGKTALSIVKHYVKEHNPNEKELQAAFPESIVRNYGVYTDLSTAKALSQDKQRYFHKGEQVIQLKDGKKVCVTNQWSKENFAALCEHVKKNFGYKVAEL